MTPVTNIETPCSTIPRVKINKDLKGLRVDSPCDNFFQTAIDIKDTLSHYYKWCTSSESIYKIGSVMDKIPRVFFLLGTLTRIHIATVNLLNASCSEIPFISHMSYPSGRLNIFATVYPRKQEIILISRS